MGASLTYLLISWGAVTSVLIVLVIYRAILGGREDDQLYLNKVEINMMESEQHTIVGRMNAMRGSIIVLSILSGLLLLATGGVWLWAGLQSF